MLYNFRFDIGFTPVSDHFISQVMPKVNGGYVKVYLYAMYLAKNHFDEDTGMIASKLGLLESDVVNALNFWQEQGALEKTDHSVIFFPLMSQNSARADSFTDETSRTEKAVSEGPAAELRLGPVQPEQNFKEKKSSDEAVEAMTRNNELSDLCMIAQDILGKTLSKADIQTLYWFYDSLGLSPEVISMLLEYCAGKNKRNLKYIEKVAISWHESGITTMDAVDEYIHSETERNHYMYSLRKLFGLNDRPFSKTEETYLEKWKNIYQMNEDMVALAYEYCIMQTNKLSFPYMNAIIERWHQRNIHTIPEAEEDRENHKTNASRPKKDSESVYSADNFDYDELDKIMTDRLKED